MKLLLTIVVAALGLFALVWLIGLVIPRRHIASRTALYDKPPEQVWALLSNFSGYAHWAPEVSSVRRLPDQGGHPVYQFEGKWGMPLAIEAIDAPHRIVTRIADPSLPFGGTWTWKIAREGSGTRVTVTEDGEIKSAPMRTMARFFFGYTSTIDSYLKALGDGLQETVTPEPVAVGT
jgi:uncharacterized protein YndB with AHSA1/START domain